ncbi:RNA polymerase sigma factor [soil metagenome]
MSLAQSDSVVLRRSLTDPRAFEELFERYFHGIYNYARRRVGGELAQDTVSEVFLRAFSKRSVFDFERESARPWLYGIANNVVREVLTSRSRANRPPRHIADPPSDTFEDVVSRLDAERLRSSINAALSLLSTADREALLLYSLADLSYEEIAEALEIPIGTVRSRLSRARRIVKPELEAKRSSGTTAQRRSS